MKKLFLSLSLALAGMTAGAQVPGPSVPLSGTRQQVISLKEGVRAESKDVRRVSMPEKAPRLSVGAPDPDMQVITDTPEGTNTLYQRFGVYYAYNWLFGMMQGELSGDLCNIVVSPDGKKVYMQNPISMFFYSEDNWIVGDLEGDIATFTFPQLISVDQYFDDEGNLEAEYLDYAMKCEFIPSEEGGDTGWYYPAEDQTYRMKLNSDGTIEPLDSDYMIGQVNWLEADGDEEAGWSWQGNGDILTSMKQVEGTPNALPEGVQTEEWQLKGEYSSRSVGVGVDGDTMYITGLMSAMKDVPAIGKIDGDKVVFGNNQYFGIYEDNNTLAYFLTGYCEPIEDEDGEYLYFYIADDMTFEYDAEKKVLTSPEGAFCISSLADEVRYYVMSNNPYICKPSADLSVNSLQTPLEDAFYAYDDEEGLDAEFYFKIPTLDAEGQIMDKSRIFYQIILDDEVYVFYSDEYILPEGIDEMTDIPFGYDNYNEEIGLSTIFANGINHGVILSARDYESLGARSLYKNPDGTTVYSDILWAPGYEGDPLGVESAVSGKSVVSHRYFDISGREISRPSKGICVRQTTYSDGSVRTQKMIAR